MNNTHPILNIADCWPAKNFLRNPLESLEVLKVSLRHTKRTMHFAITAMIRLLHSFENDARIVSDAVSKSETFPIANIF